MASMDFGQMAYYIEDIPEGESVVERFKDLSSKAEVFLTTHDLPEGVDPDKVMRYLIYMFSPGTPFRRDIPDFMVRKQAVLKKIGVVADEGTELDGYGEMCIMNKDWIIDRFITFTKFFKSMHYHKIAVAEVKISQIERAILASPVEKASEEKAIIDARRGWYKDMEEAMREIMEEETSILLAQKIKFNVKMESLGIKPEEYTVFFRDNKILYPEVIP